MQICNLEACNFARKRRQTIIDDEWPRQRELVNCPNSDSHVEKKRTNMAERRIGKKSNETLEYNLKINKHIVK